MKTCKKLLAITIALVLLVSTLVSGLVVSAASTLGTLTIESTTVNEGDNAVVNFNLDLGENSVDALHMLITVTSEDGLAITDAELVDVTYVSTENFPANDEELEDGTDPRLEISTKEIAQGKLLFESGVATVAQVTDVDFTITFNTASLVGGDYDFNINVESTDYDETDYEAIAQTGTITVNHVYEAVVTAPTCVAAGYTTYKCACGHEYTVEGDPATGVHTYGEDGKCSVCGAEEPVVEEKATAVISMINGGNTLAEYEYDSLEEALSKTYDLANVKVENKYCDPTVTLNKNITLNGDAEVTQFTTLILGDYTIDSNGYEFRITGTGKVVANYAISTFQNNPFIVEAVTDGVYTYTTNVGFNLNTQSLTVSDQIFINFQAKRNVSYTGAVEYGFDYYWQEKPEQIITILPEDFTTNTTTTVKVATMGIPAKDMSNNVVARYWAKTTVDGVDYYAYSNTVEYSVVKYASLMMGTGNDKLDVLLKDMLNYGAYFQIFKDYRVDDLANAILDEEDKVLPSQSDLEAAGDVLLAPAAVRNNLSAYSEASVYVNGRGLELLDVINIKYSLNKAPLSGTSPKLCVWTKSEYEAISNNCETLDELSEALVIENCNRVLDLSTGGNYFVVEGIAAKKYADAVIVRAMYEYNGEMYYDYLTSYSPVEYCRRSINDSASGTALKLSDVCKALAVYAKSARTYFNYTVDAG